MGNLTGSNLRLAISFATFKGIALASVTIGLGIELAKAILVGVVSALIGAVGTVVGAGLAARMTREEARKTRAVVHDVKQKVGAARRETDNREE